MINAIQVFWNETPLDDLLKLTQQDVVEKMRSYADEYSNGFIIIKIDESQVQFEGMDERNLNFDKQIAAGITETTGNKNVSAAGLLCSKPNKAVKAAALETRDFKPPLRASKNPSRIF